MVVKRGDSGFTCCEALENGDILFFPKTPSIEALSTYLTPYAKGWKHEDASVCSFNDLLHMDAFPKRPLHGTRILRFFSNIHPTENCRWMTSRGFEELMNEYGVAVSVPRSAAYDLKSRLGKKVKRWLKRPLRSPYDTFMLNMHHFLKENVSFQEKCPRDYWEFSPGSSWALFTDQVSYAALTSHRLLEQTFLVPQKVLLCPEKSPLAILQRLSGRNLVDLELLKEA